MNRNKVMLAVLNYNQDNAARALHLSAVDADEKYIIDSSGIIKRGMFMSARPYYTSNFNAASRIFLQSDCDYCLYVCSDITGDINAVIRRIQSLYTNRIGIYSPNIEGRCLRHLYRAKKGTGFADVIAVEGMCIAVHRSVIEQCYPFQNNKYGWGLDIYKCYMAKKLGMRVIIDTGVSVHHPHSSEYNRKQAKADMLHFFSYHTEPEFTAYLQQLKKANFPLLERIIRKSWNMLKGGGWRVA